MENQDDYGTVSTEQVVVKRNKTFNFKGKEVKFFKPKEAGAIMLDILVRNDGNVGYKYQLHKNVGPGGHNVVCPGFHACPICQLRKKLADEKIAEGMDSKSVYKLKEIKSLFPSERVVYNVIEVAHPELGVQLFDASGMFRGATATGGKSFEAKLTSAIMTEKQVGMLTRFPWASPTEGSMLVGTVVNAEYPDPRSGKMIAFLEWQSLTFKPRKVQYDPSIIEQTIKPEEYINLLTHAQMETLMYGGDLAGQVVEEEPQEEEVAIEDIKPVASTKPMEIPKPAFPAATPAPTEAPKPVVEPAKDVCPYGGRIGKDKDKLPECADKCDVYVTCLQHWRKLQAQASNPDVL